MPLEVFEAFIRLAIALPLVVLFIYLVIKYGIARKSGYAFLRNRASIIEVIDQVPIGMKNMLCLVKVADKYYLISCSETHASLIGELSLSEEELKLYQERSKTLKLEAHSFQNVNFKNLLNKVLKSIEREK